MTVTPPVEPEPEVAVGAPEPEVAEPGLGSDCAIASDKTTYCVDSVLKASSSGSYGPKNLFDGKPETAWVEGVEDGDGEGQTISVMYPSERSFTALVIQNGYNKSERLYQRNSRPSALLVTFSNGEQRNVPLEDRMGQQVIGLDPPVRAKFTLISILSVYPGSKYTDTAISELAFETAEP